MIFFYFLQIARLKTDFESQLKKSLAANEEEYAQKLEQVCDHVGF